MCVCGHLGIIHWLSGPCKFPGCGCKHFKHKRGASWYKVLLVLVVFLCFANKTA